MNELTQGNDRNAASRRTPNEPSIGEQARGSEGLAGERTATRPSADVGRDRQGRFFGLRSDVANGALRIDAVNQALADDDIVATLAAFSQFGRKAGMARIASSTGLGRENLYRTFRRSDIRLSTFLKLARLAGAQLELRSAPLEPAADCVGLHDCRNGDAAS